MGLFLLGIPLAMIGLASLKKDAEYTAVGLRIPDAKADLSDQCRQIDKHFVDILKYCGADCDIKNAGYGINDVKNVKRGRYGTMERYLATKGYRKEAIDYCKERFDAIADKEAESMLSKAKNDAHKFENGLGYGDYDYVLKITHCYAESQYSVERDVERLTEYFKSHGNGDCYCNIIMGGTAVYHNHMEVWHLKKPYGEDAKKYYYNVCEILDIHRSK